MDLGPCFEPVLTAAMALVHHQLGAACADQITDLAAEELSVQHLTLQRVGTGGALDRDILRAQNDICSGSTLGEAQRIAGLRYKAGLIVLRLNTTLKDCLLYTSPSPRDA